MAGIDLRAVADGAGWTLSESEPDFFGDVRVTAARPFVTVTLVFNGDGRLAGAYLRKAGMACWWRSERVTDAKAWLLSAGAL